MRTNLKPTNNRTLRVTGGEWRGRKFEFPDRPDLRPTSGRVRETLFNWLTTYTKGARCLDLFAGSGALGIEALSRGAEFCDFVDIDLEAIRFIDFTLAKFSADTRAATHKRSAEFILAGKEKWDIVFIDPPFILNKGFHTLSELVSKRCLNSGAYIYLETRRAEPNLFPQHLYTVHREKKAGDVRYQLLTVTSPLPV